MLNLIKMDICRMFKSKYTWIVVISAMALMVFGTWVSHNDIEETQSQLNAITENQSVDNADTTDFLISIGSDGSWYTGGEVSVAQLFSADVQSGMFLLFITIFCVLYVNDERKTGFIKNIAGQVSSRGLLIVSKLCSILIFTLILFIASFLATMLGSAFFFGYVNLGGTGDYLFFFAVQLLLYLGFGGFITCLVVLTKSSVASIVIGLLVTFGFINYILSFVDNLLHSAGVVDSFSITNYTVSANIGLLEYHARSGDYLQAFIVALAFLIVTAAISMFTIQKQDIR